MICAFKKNPTTLQSQLHVKVIFGITVEQCF
jgi:hypothetical protein